jgi:hypothetical protein
VGNGIGIVTEVRSSRRYSAFSKSANEAAAFAFAVEVALTGSRPVA